MAHQLKYPITDEKLNTRYAPASEIYAHCRAIAKHYDLYDVCLLNTTVIETTWNEVCALPHK